MTVPVEPVSPPTFQGLGSLGPATLPRSDNGVAAQPTPPPLPPPPSVVIAVAGAQVAGAAAASASVVSAPTAIAPSRTARYRFGDVIGEGGMGEVVLAHDEHIGRDVAVKRIRAAEPTADQMARFVREARVQGCLEHPAVVPVHDLAVDVAGRPFFVMKRLSGTTLLDLLARQRSAVDELAERRRMLRAFVDVCLAVEFAHSRGIIHRDLKPANVMLGDFGEVYVLDWGVARNYRERREDAPAARPGEPPRDAGPPGTLTTGETLLGTVLGTPAYMAPEQLAGDRAGPPADIYSLGCILYEVLTGEPWHIRQRSVGEALTEPPARPSARRADVPPELDRVCERATQPEPEARFASARALGDAVQAYLDGDRDVEVRKQLAQHHLAEARSALANGESDTDRRAAMSAAGRALALDPTATEAAELVTRLLLEPPHEVPAEVEVRLERIDADTARHQGRTAAFAMLCYFGFVPLILWTGVRDLWFIGAFVALTSAGSLQLYLLARRTTVIRGGMYVNACINAALIALVTRMVGPLIITPALAVTTLVAYTAHPRFGRTSVLAAILGAAIAVPWALEALGILEPTYAFTAAGEIVIHSPNLVFLPAPTQLAFALLLVVLLTAVAVFSRVLAQRQRDATRRLELQAWHLAQVVPSLGG